MSRKNNEERIYLLNWVIKIDDIVAYTGKNKRITILLSGGHTIVLDYNGYPLARYNQDFEFLVNNCPITFNSKDDERSL